MREHQAESSQFLDALDQRTAFHQLLAGRNSSSRTIVRIHMHHLQQTEHLKRVRYPLADKVQPLVSAQIFVQQIVVESSHLIGSL